LTTVSAGTREHFRVEVGLALAFLRMSNPAPEKPLHPLTFDLDAEVFPGARVLAVGYPEIAGQPVRATPNGFILPYREIMCGSIATVLSVHEVVGPGHSKWPTVVVDQDWRPGFQ